MSWAKFDDQVAFHPKVVAAGNAAVGAWFRMTTYCCAQLSDGFVAESAARLIASLKEIEKLIAVGLIHRVDGGYQVHDFHDFNPRAEDARAHREHVSQARREAGKVGGIHSGRSRQPSSIDEAKPKQIASGVSKQNEAPSRPVPSLGEREARADGIDLGKPDSAAQRKTVDRQLVDALPILEAVNAARVRVIPGSRPIRPTYSSLAGIASRLEAGKTAEECLLVVANCEDEVRRKPDSAQWFDQITPWRPENFEKRLAAAPTRSSVSGVKQPDFFTGHNFKDGQ